MQLVPPCIPESISWNPCKIDSSNKDSVRYFERVVSDYLPMLDSDRPRIRKLLMQMAMSDDTDSSKAVLQSMLALATLHRDGQQSHAERLKLSAIRALLVSMNEDMDARAGIQHIAAGMLLCSFEMAENNSQWIGHICGAKNVVKAVQNEPYAPGSDGAAILGWVYYYDVLATFSLRHWRTSMVKRTAAVLGFDPKQSRSCAVQYIIARDSFARKIPHISKYAHEVVGLLSEVFNTIMYTWSPQYSDEDYRQYLDGLETRLQRHLPLAGAEIGTLPQAVTKGTASEIELFRLAALVYLERASKNFSGQSKKLQCWTDEACSILAELGSCRHPFPLFIFGCEGRTDERRLAILHLIAATEQDPHVRNLREVKALIQSVWTQDDLAVDGQVEYIRKLNLVISSKDDIPSFV